MQTRVQPCLRCSTTALITAHYSAVAPCFRHPPLSRRPPKDASFSASGASSSKTTWQLPLLLGSAPLSTSTPPLPSSTPSSPPPPPCPSHDSPSHNPPHHHPYLHATFFFPSHHGTLDTHTFTHSTTSARPHILAGIPRHQKEKPTRSNPSLFSLLTSIVFPFFFFLFDQTALPSAKATAAPLVASHHPGTASRRPLTFFLSLAARYSRHFSWMGDFHRDRPVANPKHQSCRMT